MLASASTTRAKLTAILLMIALASGLLGCGSIDVTLYKKIHQASFDGNLASMEELIKTDPQLVHATDYNGNTPLHSATLHGRVQVVKYLLEKGAKVNVQNLAGMTPLHFAAREGFLEVATILLSHNADVNIRNSQGWTALKWALEMDHADIADLLRKQGGDE